MPCVGTVRPFVLFSKRQFNEYPKDTPRSMKKGNKTEKDTRDYAELGEEADGLDIDWAKWRQERSRPRLPDNYERSLYAKCPSYPEGGITVEHVRGMLGIRIITNTLIVLPKLECHWGWGGFRSSPAIRVCMTEDLFLRMYARFQHFSPGCGESGGGRKGSHSDSREGLGSGPIP